MSRLYFHSWSGDAELRGSEHAWLGHVAAGPALAAWDVTAHSPLTYLAEIVALIPEVPDGDYGANYLHTGLRDAQAEAQRFREQNAAIRAAGRQGFGDYDPTPLFRLRVALQSRLSGSGPFKINTAGVTLHGINVTLNTALAAGAPPVALAAKLYGHGPQHAWVDGEHRQWLAGVIDDGLRIGVYRRTLLYSKDPKGPRTQVSDQGWQGVLDLLRSRDDEPVVMSHSFEDGFPNPTLAGADDDPAAFYELPADRKWYLALAGLRRERPWAQLTPQTLTGQPFGVNVTVYDLLAPDRDDRVRAAAAEETS